MATILQLFPRAVGGVAAKKQTLYLERLEASLVCCVWLERLVHTTKALGPAFTVPISVRTDSYFGCTQPGLLSWVVGRDNIKSEQREQQLQTEKSF